VPAPAPPGAPGDGRATFSWSLPVRVLHALLAGTVAFDFVRDDGGQLHRLVGYAALATVAARILWAIFAPMHEGLPGLRPSLPRTALYLRHMRRGRVPRPAGHDALGLWMVWLLWSIVALLGLTGWMSGLDMFWGDDRIHDVHAALADALIVAVVVHLLGVAAMSWHWRENLLAAMVTRRERRIDPEG
jgi:cytochrome b